MLNVSPFINRLHAHHLRWLAVFIWLIAGCILMVKYQWQENLDTRIRHYLVSQSKQATEEINQHLHNMASQTENLVATLTGEALNDMQIRELIADTVITTQGAHRGGLAFHNQRYPSEQPLYSPYFQKHGDNRSDQHLSERYDYTLPDNYIHGPRTFWFHQPLSQGSMWMEPYFGTSANTWLAEYIVPFESQYDGQRDNGYDGIAFLNFSLVSLTRQVLNLELGTQGFGLLVSRSGRILAYPNPSVLGKSVYKLEKSENPLLATISSLLQRGTLTTFVHPATGREQWMVLSNIDALDAQLGLIIDANELRLTMSGTDWPWYSVWFLGLAGFAILLASIRFPQEPKAIRSRIYVMLSLCLLTCLLMLWYQALATPAMNEGETLLVNNESAQLAWQAHSESERHGLYAQGQAIKLDIQAIDLMDANRVSIVGNVVVPNQHYPDAPLYINNALDCRWSLIRTYGEHQEWQFVTLIRQPFDYKSFPFDREIIQLTLLPGPDSSASVLIPQFNSYPSMRPDEFPGISMSEAEFGSWKLLQTYFSYQPEALPDEGQTINLKYNMVIQRSITGTLISHIMPLLVVSFLTYCMLLLWTKDEKQRALWGFSTATVLQYCASLFFILVIAHVALRDALNAQGIIFIEYFYFLAYLQIICTAAGALAYTTDIEIQALEYQQGRRIKQWYWPSILLLSLLITLVFINN